MKQMAARSTCGAQTGVKSSSEILAAERSRQSRRRFASRKARGGV